MKIRISLAMAATALLGACVEPGTTDPNTPPPQISENIIALAGPNQDLSTVRLVPEDDCFWYVHRGPVEDTLLPLRTADGRPICAKRDAPA